MKELSIEEKAKRYDEAIEIARQIHDADRVSGIELTTCEEIFPELAESEDERIRKDLIIYLRSILSNKKYGDKFIENWIAWLEKQGEQKPIAPDTLIQQRVDALADIVAEQKPADKVEPKFKEGDWISGYYTSYKVLSVNNDGYVVEDVDGNKINILFENEKFHHLWTIQDAKDGDVLHSTGWHNDCIFIFNGLDNWKFDEPNGDRAVATGYCCLSVSADKMEFGMQGPDCIEVDTVKPASKIQRDLLFQKMKEAGYEWDAEKKELKKIEQNPVWSEEDDYAIKRLLCLLDNEQDNYPQLSYDFQELQEIKDWLKSLRPQNTWKPSDEQIKVCKEVYADILSAKGFDLGTVNGELNRLEEELKKLNEE